MPRNRVGWALSPRATAAAACLAAGIASVACADAFVELFANVFDFSVTPRLISVVRGDPDADILSIDIEVLGGDAEKDTCSFSFSPSLVGVSFAAVPQPFTVSCAPFRWSVAVRPEASVGTTTIDIEGRYTRVEGTETVVHSITLEVLPDVTVDLSAPAAGLTVLVDTITVQATAEDVFGDVELVEVQVGSAAPVATFVKLPGTSQPTYGLTQVVTLTPGENLIRVRATNTVGNTAVDEVTVTYAPVTAGTVRWDGEAGDGLWFTPSNWDGDRVPGPGDAVVVHPVPGTIARFVLDGESRVRSLDQDGVLIVAGGTLRVAEGARIAGEVNVFPDGVLPGLPRPTLAMEETLTVEGRLVCNQGDLLGGAVETTPAAELYADNCGWRNVTVENSGRVDVVQRFLTFFGTANLINLPGGEVWVEEGGLMCGDAPCAAGVENQGRMVFTGFRSRVEPFLTNLGSVEFRAAVTVGPGRNEGVLGLAGGSNLEFVGPFSTTPGSRLGASSVRVASLDALHLAGTVEVVQLEVASSTVRFLPGARVAPIPLVDIQGGRLEVATGTGDPDVEVATLLLNVGDIRVEAGRTLYVRNSLGWMEGTVSGGGRTIVSQATLGDGEATLSLQGFGPMTLDGHELRVFGATSWQAGNLVAGNGAVFMTSGSGFGSGIFQALGDDTFDGNGLGGTAARFINDGIVRKSGGTGTTTIEACYEERPGALVQQQSGTLTIVQLC